MIKDLFINNCGEEIFKKDFSEIYNEAMLEYEKCGVFFLSEEYIREVDTVAEAYPRILSLLIEEAKRIKENPSLAVYALFLHRAMQKRELFKNNIEHFALPVEEYPLFAFLCLIPAIKNTYFFLKEKGIDSDIIKATIRQYEECVFIYSKRFDRLGMNKRYFDWLQHYVDCEILNINRLRFEILPLSEPIRVLRNTESGEDVILMEDGDFNTDGLYLDTPPKKDYAFSCKFSESDTSYTGYPVNEDGKATGNALIYPKSLYKTVIKRGDVLLSVHIPVDGDFSREACRESYERAKEVFARFFPDIDVKGFVCYSWMMSPELRFHMKPTSRVLGFASPYAKFPIHTEGEDVLNFVFYLKFKTYEDLAEDTSLQRSLKRLYLNGERLYEYGGIFAVDKIN